MHPQRYQIFDTKCWVISHRRDARYPGYLMISSREPKQDIYELSTETLTELGSVLRGVEVLLRHACSPMKVIFAKLGFSAGFGCHFHAAPISAALLAEIASHAGFTAEPDGNDALRFLSRIYCERKLNEDEERQQAVTIAGLREKAAKLGWQCRSIKR